MTFSEGPRLCIGYRLAIFEYKAILAAIIRAGVRFEPSAGNKMVRHRFSGTMQPYVVGEEEKGMCLPVRVGLVKE